MQILCVGHRAAVGTTRIYIIMTTKAPLFLHCRGTAEAPAAELAGIPPAMVTLGRAIRELAAAAPLRS